MYNHLTKRLLWALVLPLFVCSAAFAQERVVKGTILDQSTGQPLSGVTVSLKGGGASVVTDNNGMFSIRVTGDRPVLQFSYIGYESMELRPGGGDVRVTLKKQDKSMDEVVVIGYGTVKKRDLTGAVSSVKAADIVRSPTNNPLEAVQGMVPGADITKSSGKAGAGVNIVIRGNRTINGSSGPLVIIDGLQGGTLENMNPNDIESIEFLKDASSTAIYGSQGANGVIIVTTKKGTAGKVKVNYNGYAGANGWVQYPKPRMGQSYLDLRRAAYQATGAWASPADDKNIFSASELSAINANQWVDWVDLLTQTGLRQSHSVSVAGGSEKTKMYLSAGYFGDNGMIRFNNLKQYNTLLNVEQVITPWLKAGAQASFVYSNYNTRGTDPYSLAGTATPLGKPYDSAGRVNVYPVAGNPGLMSPLSDDRGPLIATNNNSVTQTAVNVHLDMEPIKGLTFRTQFGGNFNSGRSGKYYDSSSLEEVTNKYSYAAAGDTSYRFYDWDNILTYNKQIGDHSFTVTGLTSYTHRTSENYGMSGTGLLYSSQLFYALSGAPNNRYIVSNYVQTDNMSYAGRINYAYKGKYLLTVTERVDGASILSTGHKWASFPSAAAAWRISDESFMEHVDPISNLKLRFSYGVAGNSGIPAYGTQSVLNVQPMGFENTAAPAYIFSTTIGNAALSWELSKTADLGIDLGLLKNRIDLTVDVYNTNTSNILLLRTLPSSLGIANSYQNVGESRNRGIEVALNTRNFDGPRFKWLSTVSFTSNQERITGLINGSNIIDKSASETNSLLIGHPVHSFYNYVKEGIWQTADASKAGSLVFGTTPFKPGDIRLKDINGDGKITPDSDRVYIGSTVPKWSLGFQNTFMFAGFDLTIYAIARYGQMINDKILGRYNPAGQGNNGPAYFDYWTPTHASNDYPAPKANSSLTIYPGSTTLQYVDGSYVKLKTATLGYTLPPAVARKAYMSSLRAYVTCNNIFVKAKSRMIKNYDPERGGDEDAPLSRQLVFGLNIGF